MGIKRATPSGHPFELFADVMAMSEKAPLHRGRPRRPGRSWGWDCTFCDTERTGFKNMKAAEQDCLDFHEHRNVR